MILLLIGVCCWLIVWVLVLIDFVSEWLIGILFDSGFGNDFLIVDWGLVPIG